MPLPSAATYNAPALRHGLHALVLVVLLGCADRAFSASIRAEPWGVTRDGQKIERVTLENDRGMRLSYVDYGATITSIEVPDRDGKRQNIVLSLPDLASYEQTRRKFAAIIGRYAGRIADARFPLDGRTVALVPGNNGVTLHGGPAGYDRRVWLRQDFSDAVSMGSTFHLVSADGDQQFPGRLDIHITYRLYRNRNEFGIEYAASTDAPTVINLTNHAFFNLAGAGAAGLATHRFQIHADRFAQTDSKRIPTGTIASVSGTALDFRQSSSVATRLNAASVLLGNPPGFDHSLLFSGWTGKLALVAVIDDAQSGRRMQILTTEPSVQFNSGNGFDGSETGSEGRAYQRYDGFALETQHLPDSPNHPNFPSTTLRPGQPYRSVTTFHFSIAPRSP